MKYRYYHLNFIDDKDEFICKATISRMVYEELNKRAKREQMNFENYIGSIIYESTGLFLCGLSDAGRKKPHPIWNTPIMKELKAIFGYDDDKIIEIQVDRDKFIGSAENLVKNLKDKFDCSNGSNPSLRHMIRTLEMNIANMKGLQYYEQSRYD